MDAKGFEETFNWAVSHWAFCAFVIGMVFEVPHWKLKPFTTLFKFIGRMINRPVIDEVQKLDKKVDILKKDVDKLNDELKDLRVDVDRNEMDTIRSAVLDFANTCRNGRGHSKEEFDHIIKLNDKYEDLLEKYDLKNGVYEVDYSFILSERERCQMTNSFLA